MSNVESVRSVLNSGDAMAIFVAVHGLKRNYVPLAELFEEIHALAGHEHHLVRNVLANTIGRLGGRDSRALPAFGQDLESSNALIRGVGAHCIGYSCNQQEALAYGPKLLLLLENDPDEEVKEFAAVALGRIGFEPARTVLSRLANSEGSNFEQEAQRGLDHLEHGWNSL